MENHASFREYAIVACGTLNMELNHLRDSGFLDAKKILYTKPGRHEVPQELESQLIRQIGPLRNTRVKLSWCMVVSSAMSMLITLIGR
jgi:hypothetical protein